MSKYAMRTEMSGSTDIWLMHFHVDWSFACKRLEKDWELLAKNLRCVPNQYTYFLQANCSTCVASCHL